METVKRAAALTAYTKRLRPGQVIELYHATKLMPAPLRPRCARWLADQGLLFGFKHRGDQRYLITREGWTQLKRHWHLIADKVHGYPKVKR